MDRDLLSHLPVIICVARHRSFAAAAAELGMSPSAVSHAVRSVEDRLATPLFARTTRSVSVTEAGARFNRRRRACAGRYGQGSRRIDPGTRAGDRAVAN